MRSPRSLSVLGLSLALSLAFAQKAAAPKVLTVDDLLKAAKTYDQKEVKVSGKIDRLDLKTSKKGNKYTTLSLVGKDPKKFVKVYMKGHPDAKLKLAKGKMITAFGKYAVEKKLGDSIFKNEIDASKVDGKKYGITAN
ncbi:MAG: hypothetical protein JNJ45_12465 [Chthonomonas sp.]|nr:hypothetical protein [Chthonomonas sp.]